jgi:hypothetical protein
MIEALIVASPQTTWTGRSNYSLCRDGKRFPPASVVRLDNDDLAFGTQRSSHEFTVADGAFVASLARRINGPVMLAVAAVLPKIVEGKIVRESMRTAGALDRGFGTYVKVDLMRRAIDAHRARGQ